MRVGSRTNGRSAIHTAAQDVEALDATGLLAESDGQKCSARGQVVRQVGPGGALHPITRLLPSHDTNSSQPHRKRLFRVTYLDESCCGITSFTTVVIVHGPALRVRPAEASGGAHVHSGILAMHRR